jgi:putative hydrolase
MFGVHLYRAAEANIINLDGDLDLWPETQARLDYLIASMHIRGVSPEGHSAEQTTQMWKNAMKNPYVKILGHPENIPFPIILEEFVAEAKAHRKIIEVNSSSYVTRPNSVGVLEQLVAEAKRQEALMVITSDAHFAGAVAKFDRALELVQKLGVSEELIVNTSLEQLERHVFTKNDCLCWKPMFTRERERL